MRIENKIIKLKTSYAEIKDTGGEGEIEQGLKMELDHCYWVKWEAWERWQLY